MKNLTLISVSVIFLSFSAFSQKVGVLLAPQGTIFLTKAKSGFSAGMPIVLMGLFLKGDYAFIPRYNLSNNSAGIIISKDFNSKVSGYLIGMKSVMNENGYVGLGLTRKVSGNNMLFVELGTSIKAIRPEFSIGVLLPFLL